MKLPLMSVLCRFTNNFDFLDLRRESIKRNIAHDQHSKSFTLLTFPSSLMLLWGRGRDFCTSKIVPSFYNLSWRLILILTFWPQNDGI